MTYTTASGVQIPQGPDAFNPPAQFRTWADGDDVFNNFLNVNLDSERTALAPPKLRDGVFCSVRTTKTLWVYQGTTWVIAGGPLQVGTFGSDGNGTVSGSTLVRDPFGWVDLTATTARTNSTTYATSLILGVLPVGFRPVQDTVVPVLTYGSGSLNQAILATTGTVTLLAASPAGHTAARITARFQGA